MSALREINESVRRGSVAIDADHRSKQFVRVAQILAMHSGDVRQAREFAAAKGLLPEIQTVLKGAVGAGSISSGELSPLHEFERMGEAYLATLRSASAFDALLPFMRNVPFRSKIVISTSGAAGAAIVPEGAPKPISSLTLSGGELEQVKAVAITVLSRELLRLGGAPVLDLFERELRNAVSLVPDTEFIARITSGVTPITSAGPIGGPDQDGCEARLCD